MRQRYYTRNFRIEFDYEEEQENYCDIFGDDPDSLQIQAKIESGEYVHYIIICNVYLNGELVGYSLLGSNVATSLDVIQSWPTIHRDLVNEAVSMARQYIKKVQSIEVR